MKLNDCSQYWDHADHIPLEGIISYWCELSGQDQEACREAKKHAVLSAIRRGEIGYLRRDGKPFDDDVDELVRRGQLLIEKDSFNKWAAQFADAPVMEKPMGNRERETLLTIIGLVCKEAKLDFTKASKAASFVAGIAQQQGISIGETTIEGHLKKVQEALASRMK